MKALFKNKIFLASAATVMVAAIAVTSILLLPKTEATNNESESTPSGITSSAAPAGLDVINGDTGGTAQSDTPSLPPEANEPELTIPVDDKNPNVETPATAEPGKVETGSKDKPGTTAVPDDRTESGSKTAGPQKEDGASAAGDAQGKEDYAPKPGDEPHYGANDNPPPPNNIDEIPDTEPDDTPGNTEGGGEPGDGIKF